MKSGLSTGLAIGALASGVLAAELQKMQNGVIVDAAGRTLYCAVQGITLRNPFDERVDHRGRVSHGMAARNEISPIDK